MADAHKNFAYSLVATAPSPASSGTSLVVTAGQGALFPAVPFNATIWPTAAQPLSTTAEIVRVTAISTDTLTITRAQEGSSARTVVVGDQIAATVTAKTLTDAEIATDPIWDAKGDLVAATGADAAARLAVGSDGTTPVANTNSTAGIMWAKRFGQAQYVVGAFYGFMGPYTAAGSGFVLEELRAVPIFVGRRQAFDRILLRCGGGTAGLVVRLGIFADNGGPDTVILDAGTVDGASGANDKTITISQTLDPGMYWLAGCAQGATPLGSLTAMRAGSSTHGAPGLWRGDAANATSAAFFRSGVTGAFATLTPVLADFANPTAGYAVMLRAA